jgi:hypothetical protein
VPNLAYRTFGAALAVVGIGAGAVVLGTGSSAAQAPTTPTLVAIPNAASDIAVSGAGDVRIATGAAYRSRKAAVAQSLVPAGAPVSLLKATARRAFVVGTFTPSSVLVTYNPVDRKGAGELRAFTVRADGSRTAAQRLTTAGADGFRDGDATVGPTGAVAMPFIEQRPHHGRIERLAFRAAGSTSFGRKPATLANEQALRDGVGIETLLGPDGGGVVIFRPGDLQKGPPYLRRLAPTGTLGPKLAIDAPLTTGATLSAAFAPSGALIIAVLTGGPPYPGPPNSSLMTSSLAPGAPVIPPFKRIDSGSISSAANDNLAVAVGANDHTVILAGSDANTDDIGGAGSDVIAQRIYEGTGADVALIDSLTAWFPNTSRVALAPDGAITAVWAEDQTQSAAGDHLTAGIYGARRDPGGTFTTPRLLSTKAPFDGDRVEDLTQLDDGRVAVQYRRYGEGNDPGRVYLLFTRP